MVERFREKIKALEFEKADLVALMVKVDAKIEVYNELIEEMTAPEPAEPNGEGNTNNTSGYSFEPGV